MWVVEHLIFFVAMYCMCAVCDVPRENDRRDWWQKLPVDRPS